MRYGSAGIRKDSWTHNQDIILAETIIKAQESGTSINDAAAMDAPLVGKSASSCVNRWYGYTKHHHWDFDREETMPVAETIKPTKPPSDGLETADYIKSTLTPEGYRGYLTGIILDCIIQAPRRGGVEEYKRAQRMIDRLIEEGTA